MNQYLAFMKKNIFRVVFMAIFMMANFGIARSQVLQPAAAVKKTDPWNKFELLKPDALAEMIQTGQKVKIYNIGVVQNIKGAINMGAATEKENLEKFKKVLAGLPSNTNLVIYCGCCPMDRCPNIRPAFQLLKDMKFINAKLLELPVNVKTDWIDKGYPVD